MLGEQSLRGNAAACPPRRIEPAFDDDFASIGETNTDNLGEMTSKEQNRHRGRSQEASTPGVNPGRQI